MSAESNEKTHSHYTEIPLRSFEAMAFEGHLSEVLLALFVDPFEATDVAGTIWDICPTRIELSSNGKIVDASITLSDFANLPSKHAFEQLKITLSQWAMTTENAEDALRTLTNWDGRFGVWCACAVAREALRFVLEGELRPLRAIEAAEAWVRVMAIAAPVSAAAACAVDDAAYAVAAYKAADAAHAAAIDADADADAAAEAAAHSAASAAATAAATIYVVADDIAAAAYAASNVVTFAADAAAYAADDSAVWNPAFAAEMIRLREVVANACKTFPG